MLSQLVYFILFLCCFGELLDYTKYWCRYHYHYTAQSWASAREICGRTNRTLLIIDSPSEMNNITGTIMTQVEAVRPDAAVIGSTIWIGLHQEIDPVRLLWDNCAAYTMDTNQWSVSTGSSEGCVVFNVTSSTYSVENCSDLQPFICEDPTEADGDCFDEVSIEAPEDEFPRVIQSDGSIDGITSGAINECVNICYEDSMCAAIQIDNDQCYRNYYDETNGLNVGRPPASIYIRNIFKYTDIALASAPVISDYYCPEVSSSIAPSSVYSSSSTIASSTLVYSSDVISASSTLSFGSDTLSSSSPVYSTGSSLSNTDSSIISTGSSLYHTDSSIVSTNSSTSSTGSSLFHTDSSTVSIDSSILSTGLSSFYTDSSFVVCFDSSFASTYSSISSIDSLITSKVLSTPAVITSSFEVSGTTSSSCYCACTNPLSSSSITTAELQEKINQMQAELTVDKKETSSYKRKLTSAPDNRVSAQSIGYVGVVILTVVIGLLVCIDIPTLAKDIKAFCHRASRCCKS